MTGASGGTIFALSSGAPPAAIAVVRISGPAAGTALQRLAGHLPSPRVASLVRLRDDAGAVLDRAMAIWLPGPRTATGEDLAELHLHGGRAVVNAVLVALGGIDGCRAAAPGEFTRRAFANGRIDLLQAEGLADLLRAETDVARRRALRLAEGGLSRLADAWRERLLVLLARAEAVLEFGADDPEIAADPGLGADIAALAGDIAASLAHPPAERLRDGLRVVVAGPPNAGKSTLVNALAGREVALTTPIPGTTRDLVEAPVVLGGIAFVLIDSAGLRETADPVERLGVARATEAIAGADLTLWLGAPADAPPGETLLIHPRCDLPEREPAPRDGALEISARTGAGMSSLHARLIERAGSMVPDPADPAWTGSQRAIVEEMAAAIARARGATDELIVAEELRAALHALDGMTGRRIVETMLDRLFERFCVGK